MIPDLTPAEIRRFYSKILIAGCGMRWNGPVNNHGYGRFEISRGGKRVRILVHRLSYKLATGEDPGSSKIRHGCDTPPCCTPDCLDPGTQTDNMQDAIKRGRANHDGLSAYRAQRDEKAASRLVTGIKQCSRCKETKPLDQFSRSAGEVDGHAYWCKQCFSTHQARVKTAREPAPPVPQPVKAVA